MRLSQHHLLPLLLLALLASGCATGESSEGPYVPPVLDAAGDTIPDSMVDAPWDQVVPLDGGVEAGDAAEDVFPPDTAQDTAPDVAHDAGQDALQDGSDPDAPCPTGYTGPSCDQCDVGFLACGSLCVDVCSNCPSMTTLCNDSCVSDCAGCTGLPVDCAGSCQADCSSCAGQPLDCQGSCVDSCSGSCGALAYTCDGACVGSCGQCTGKPATCDATEECLESCATCSGSCVECPSDHHACPAGCHADVADDPSVGCMFTCDDQPCPEPTNGHAICTSGTCDIECNSSVGFQESPDGLSCVCDTANGFVEDPQLGACVCPSGTKGCVGFCADLTDPAVGCSAMFCAPCSQPLHSSSVYCNPSGDCDFDCDAANGYIKNASGTACVCPPGMNDTGTRCECPPGQKMCGGSCVSTLLTTYGCVDPACDPCPQPAHAVATCGGPGGTCDFACDAANGYVPNAAGDACECAPGLIDYGTYCACPVGEKICNAACVSMSSTLYGCAGSACDPCAEPAHATANCAGTGGLCDFACDASGHWIKNGSACVCASGYKDCGGAACLDATSPTNGCSDVSCTACPLPTHAVSSNCNGPGGTCDFVCDAAGHWVKNGSACVCDVGYKDCGGVCVDATTPTNGCAGAVCSACPLPAHATSTNCNGPGGTCDFVCDAAGHWIKFGTSCVCEPGYTEVGGVCVPACPGTTYNGYCYWYVSTAASFDAAESDCAASGAHLVSIADSAENSFVQTLGSADIWIGLRDFATISQNVNADDCTDNVWLSGDGGRYMGDTDEWNDVNPCGISSDSDDIFGLGVTVPSVYVLSTADSTFDTVLGLSARINDVSGYTSCVGTAIECDDDDGPGSTALLVRYLDAGNYTIIMDGFSGSWGNYVLDVRRFDFLDGSSHVWANWGTDEPNNWAANEDCAEMLQASGQWNDLDCSTPRAYVCKRLL